VRTTITLDDDVAAQLQSASRRKGEAFKQTLNRVVRAGLAVEDAPVELPRFKVRARRLGIPHEWMEGSTQDLLDRLDGPFSR
jgi:hypothetical protein